MARYLGIDYGKRRLGLALSEERGFMAFPYGVLDTQGMTPDALILHIGELCKKEDVSAIVVGIPRGLSEMQSTEMTDYAMGFADKIKSIGLPVSLEEEFLTSRQALVSEVPKDRIDASAAALILQTFLDRQRNMIK